MWSQVSEPMTRCICPALSGCKRVWAGTGLLYVGDGKMASRDTRARIAAAGDFYLCPLPQVQLEAGEFDAALEAVRKGEQVLSSVVREDQKGQPEVIAEGYEYPVA